MTKYLSLDGLEYYHKTLMKFLNDNWFRNYTSCPNCGAAITGSKCEFCETVFKMPGYKEEKENNG